MSAFSQKLNVANFTCRFGHELVLLDLFDQVVFPAFSEGHVRSYGDTNYHLIDVNLIKFNEAELVVAGRIVKNTRIEREQVFHNGVIVKDRIAIESAPTSFFLLRLSDHKVLFVRENQGAPSLSEFKSTVANFLSQSYKLWMRKEYEEKNSEGRSVTWAALHKEYPAPSLEITSIATEESVSAYVEKFRTINTIEVRLLDTNHELDNSPIFGEMREIKGEIGADKIILRTQKSGDVGMDKGSVSKFIGPQAEEGNSRIVIRGKALNGEKLVAENESFNVAIPIKNIPQDIVKASNIAMEKLSSQISLGVISLKKGSEKSMEKIKKLIEAREWQ